MAWTEEKRKEYHRLYAREFRKKHKERLALKEKNRYLLKKRYQRRAKQLGDRRCMFCYRFLATATRGPGKMPKLTTKCEDCRKDPRVKAYLRNLYMRRFHAKQKGLTPEPIVFTKVVYRHGKFPSKAVIPTPPEVIQWGVYGAPPAKKDFYGTEIQDGGQGGQGKGVSVPGYRSQRLPHYKRRRPASGGDGHVRAPAHL